jgi:hypothetical protein
MNTVPDVQSAIIEQLQALLAAVPGFGASVQEGSVMRLLDAEDPGLGDNLIILQETSTEESERVGTSSCKETLNLSIVAITRRLDNTQSLRAGRLAIKQALNGLKAGLTVPGVVKVAWGVETPMYPAEGRRWAARVLPIAITYTQSL